MKKKKLKYDILIWYEKKKYDIHQEFFTWGPGLGNWVTTPHVFDNK